MFPFTPPRIAGKSWTEIERDDKHALFRCRLCRRLAAAKVGERPSACCCEGKP